MSPIVKKIVLILFMLAILAYTFYNYYSGKSDQGYFLIATGMMLFFLVSIVNSLIQDLKNK